MSRYPLFRPSRAIVAITLLSLFLGINAQTPVAPAPTAPVAPSPTAPVAPVAPAPVAPVAPAPTAPTAPTAPVPAPTAPVPAPVRPGTPEPTKSLSLSSINYGDAIDCDAPLTLNVGGRAYPRLVPTTGVNNCFLQLTTDDATTRASTAFAQFRFMERNLYDFTVRFTYRMFGTALGIGDGLAFLLHHDPRGGSALGGVGGNLGVYGDKVINSAVVIEFDSFQNSNQGDDAQFAIHVRTVNATGAVRTIAQAPAPVRSTSMTNMKEAIISYQGGRLVVTLDKVVRIDLRTDLNKVLTRREVFVGFASATDQSADFHDIFKWTMQQGPPTAAPSSMPSRQPTTARQRSFFARIFDVIRIIIATLGRMQG